MIGQADELHGDTRPGRIDAELPERVQRLPAAHQLLLEFEALFGAPAEDLEQQLVHGAEVVVHQLWFETGVFGDLAEVTAA